MGRLGRPGGVQQHHPQGRAVLRPGRARHQGVARRRVRPRAALRHPRARDGLDHERHRAARRHPGVRRDLPDLLRLHAPRGAVGGAHAAAGDLRVDPRLDRPRRGRSDAPAGRAPRCAPGDPRPLGRPARRRQRDRRRLEGDPRAPRRTSRPVPDPAERHDVPARHRRRRPAVGGRLRRRPRRLRAGRHRGHPRRDPDRHRLRGAAGRPGPCAAHRARRRRPRRLDAVPRVVRRPGPGLPGQRAAAGGAGPGSASRPVSPRAGTRSSATPDASSRWSTSERAPSTQSSTRSSASPPPPSPALPRRASARPADPETRSTQTHGGPDDHTHLRTERPTCRAVSRRSLDLVGRPVPRTHRLGEPRRPREEPLGRRGDDEPDDLRHRPQGR